jgi:sulfite reductase (NADPH) hemoprotein beta-component
MSSGSAKTATGSSASRWPGELTEDEFKPLRLMNGLYLQLHAYMLRVAIPYGTLNGAQMRKLAHDRATATTRATAISPRARTSSSTGRAEGHVPDILEELADVEMHAIQTSGNCIRNVTADHFAGAAADEIEDPRPYAEIRASGRPTIRSSFLPRKFKIAVTGAPNDRAADQAHDIGLRMVRDETGEIGFEVFVGGGLGRTPMIGKVVRDFLPEGRPAALSRGDPARLQPATAGATTSTRRASRSSCTRPASRRSAPGGREFEA